MGERKSPKGMSKDRGKSRERAQASAEPSGAKPEDAKPPRLTTKQRAKLAQETRDEVFRKASEMVKKMIEDVKKKGSHTTAKFLFDFAGIDQIPLNEKQRKQAEDSLAALLLSELQEKRSDADSLGSGGTKLHLTH